MTTRWRNPFSALVVSWLVNIVRKLSEWFDEIYRKRSRGLWWFYEWYDTEGMPGGSGSRVPREVPRSTVRERELTRLEFLSCSLFFQQKNVQNTTVVKTRWTQKHKAAAATSGITVDFHSEKDSSSNFTSTEYSSYQQNLGFNSSFCLCTDWGIP